MIMRRLSQYFRVILFIAVAALFAGTGPAQAAVCTLADHIKAANTNTAVGFCPAGASHDIIAIAEDITLTEPLPPITGTITIEGGGHAISGDGLFRIFDVQDGGRLTIKQLTLINGNGGSLYGGAVRLEQGDTHLLVEDSTFRNNTARFGGAIGARRQSRFGGASGARSQNSVTIRNSSFISNSAEIGGAITLAASEATVESSSFRQNLARSTGGAIQTYSGEIAINNSTLFSNVAGAGGAIYVNGGDVALTHLTMLDNAASGPEGAGLRRENRRGRLNLYNSIIAGGSAASQCSARIEQNVGNLIEDWSCNPEYGGDPMLDRVEGPSLYFAPRDDSPVINAAYQMFCLARDQIGTARPYGAACEIGAIESTSDRATSAGPLVGVCTLRDRIVAANSNQAVGNCPAGTSHDVITISEDIMLRLPLPPITGTITIEGGGHTISGDGKFRIFLVNGGNLTVNNLTLADGFSDGSGGAIHVRAGGRLTVNNSAFTGNRAGLDGGAIDLTGSTRQASSDPNVSDRVVYSRGSGLTVNDSSFIENRSGSYGGAIRAVNRTKISNSSFIKNTSRQSGGAINGREVSGYVVNSTFSGNRADGIGGALVISGDVTLTHLTMVDNSGRAFEDLGRVLAMYSGDNIQLRNSVIVGGVGGNLCGPRLAGNIANFISDGSCSAPMSGDARLGELTGSPAHHPPLDGSPALDNADPRFCPDTDQLGRPRPQGNGCDLGAIESMTAVAVPTAVPAVCPLPDQIIAANTDTALGNCPAGNGADTIHLIRDIDLDATLPPITSEITIEGNGFAISGSRKFRIFDVDGGRLTISDMTLRDGDAIQGGAIRLRNGAQVSAKNVTFSDNAADYGGAISTESSDVRLDVSESRFIGNKAEFDAGALLADGGIVNISGSALRENRANLGGYGGAIETRKGSVAISNSTFSDNLAGQGGAIYSHGADTTLTHVTLMNNRANHIVGAGIYHHSGTLNLRNSIVAGSGRGDDCYGRPTGNRGNLSQDGTCSTDVIGGPLLAEMAGAVEHYPLLDASPAHAAADPAFCLPTDQLGNPRPFCDIGAIESERAGDAQPPPAQAIPADCTLADQIVAANSDAPAGACPAGDGADVITLREDIRLNEALPTISSDLTIRGNGHTIDGNNRFRIFDIAAGEVNIKNMTLINGSSPGEHGGAILARDNADVVVAQVTFRNNRAGWGGGAASIEDSRLHASYSRFFDNAAEEKGGGLWFNSRECYDFANPIFDGNSSGAHIPDPEREIFAPHVEFGSGVWSRCETAR